MQSQKTMDGSPLYNKNSRAATPDLTYRSPRTVDVCGFWDLLSTMWALPERGCDFACIASTLTSTQSRYIMQTGGLCDRPLRTLSFTFRRPICNFCARMITMHHSTWPMRVCERVSSERCIRANRKDDGVLYFRLHSRRRWQSRHVNCFNENIGARCACTKFELTRISRILYSFYGFCSNIRRVDNSSHSV